MEKKHLSLSPKYRHTRQQAKEAESRRLAPLVLAMKALHSVSVPDSMDPEELERQRKNQEILGKLFSPMNGLNWESFTLGEIPAAWTRLPKGPACRRVILYCHGGGYTSGNLGYARVLSSKLCRATGFDVLSFEYRLAPEHPYPAALEDALLAWDYLMENHFAPENVILAGDSAGGNLALVLSLYLKEKGRPLPGALLLFSPWTDLTLSGESLESRADIDPVLTPEYVRAVRDAYTNGASPDSPLLTPLLGDFAGFPPVLIQIGTNEILHSDSLRLEEKLKEAGVPCLLEEWDDMWHVFQMYPTKKASDAIRNTAYFLLSYL